MMPKEKTNIVPRSKAQAPEAHTPGPQPVANDAITFFCSNGHRLRVPVAQAGKQGTCTKCGVVVKIPAVDSASKRQAATTPAASQPVVNRAQEHLSTIDFAVDTSPKRATAKQAVPEGLSDALTEAPPALDDSAEESELKKLFQAVAQSEEPPEAPESHADVEAIESVIRGDDREPTEEVLHDNPTAQLVARLWLEREHGGIVELHITGGSVILPTYYERQWSRGTHGLFASEAADGSVTLTAVAWDSIQKIVVRQVQGLPEGFD